MSAFTSEGAPRQGYSTPSSFPRGSPYKPQAAGLENPSTGAGGLDGAIGAGSALAPVLDRQRDGS
jgi:hypothetical protein